MATQIPHINDLINEAKTSFKQNYNVDPSIAAFAPGRVNIIGEHTDYNDGFVFPMVTFKNSNN